ncbi:Alpha/beta hydrolase family protein [Luteitalea pratensis]|uniref:Alpha/beta hydrolase family protein n=1 Tax=Luteitalea pratensis TaxID=1855912 RepID=A0A143PH70_LUTPR|nr:Alpha/beta hydrolase family protein [Luteitalea pratensis]
MLEIVGVITEAAQVFVEARTLAGIRAAKEGFAAPGQIDRLARHHGAKARWVLDAWTESWLAPAFANWTIDADLRRIRCAILAMHGNRDDYGSRAHPERIAALAPTAADIVWLSACGHVPHRAQTDAVLTAIQTFIANRVTLRTTDAPGAGCS